MTLESLILAVKCAKQAMQRAADASDEFVRLGVFENCKEEYQAVFTAKGMRAALARGDRVSTAAYGMQPRSANPSNQLSALKLEIARAQAELNSAINEFDEFVDSPENNKFASVDEASAELEERFRERAHSACEGSYCMGLELYSQEFTADGKRFMFRLHVEYNRHDKTYYYVESAKVNIEELSNEQHSNPIPAAPT